MRLNKLVVYLGVVALLCTLSFGEDVGDDDEDDVEVDSENEPEDKVRKRKSSFACFRDVPTLISLRIFNVWQSKGKKKAVETESYTPPVIALEHEDSVFLAEPFAERSEFESR